MQFVLNASKHLGTLGAAHGSGRRGGIRAKLYHHLDRLIDIRLAIANSKPYQCQSKVIVCVANAMWDADASAAA